MTLYRNFLLLLFPLFFSISNAATDNYLVSTIAGKAREKGYSDGIASVSRLDNAHGIAVNKQGDVFFSDTANHTIRRIEKSTGVVTTYAGVKDNPGTDDGEYAQAKFQNPIGLVVDRDDLYAVDSSAIRKIDTTGKVTTIAGQANVECYSLLHII